LRTAVSRRPAWIALGAALLLWGGYALVREPLRVRWLVARGAPPAPAEASAAAAEGLRAMGPAVRASLVEVLRSPGRTRAARSWVAALLLRGPFFATADVEACLASADPSLARAAAFALLNGEERAPSFEESVGEALVRGRSGGPPPARIAEPWDFDPAPAVPVLLAWLADQGDGEAHHAARLLGYLPPRDPRVAEALAMVVEEMPEILAPGAPPALQVRKLAVVNAIQSLLGYAPADPEIVRRVGKVIGWIESNGLSERGWDVENYAMRLLAVSGGRGIDFEMLSGMAASPNRILRKRLADTLGELPGAEATAALERLVSDEHPIVRRAALRAMRDRGDAAVLRLAPYLVEDSYIFIRSDTLRTIGERNSADPGGVRALLPLLVSCIEDPWPGSEPSSMAPMIPGGKADVVEAAALSLVRATGLHPGFSDRAMDFEWKERQDTAKRLAGDAELRRVVAAEWRRTVPARAPEERVPYLEEHLKDRDPENVLRAMREILRITGQKRDFPPAALEQTGDDTNARNAVREWMKK